MNGQQETSSRPCDCQRCQIAPAPKTARDIIPFWAGNIAQQKRPRK